MSWLRNNPAFKQRDRDSPPKDADPSACYDSFCIHWQQTYEIILHSSPPKGVPSQDDVLGVVNHIDQMVTLLSLELRDHNLHNYQQTNTATHSPCLEHLLSENLLVKLYSWSVHTGRFKDAVRVEQIKLYELLVLHNGALLAHEPITRPLLRLLEECENDIIPLEVEKKLVVLLNQLCVALMQNMALLDLFFHPTAPENKFIIFSLLIPRIHKESSMGQQARDAMLLCMSLSKKNDEVGLYIAEHSNICPVLAAGLSGLYSVLPRKLDIETNDWHQLTPDDVNDLPELTQLMNSLEFCNAVAQVAHPMVQKQLLEFLYQGFLIPVIGPALLQDSIGLTLEQLDAPQYWTTVEELVTATAYFDLFLRSVTHPGLLRLLLQFLLLENYDDCKILDNLIKRISCRSRLCIVTLALFETLVNLNCEDVMLELCLRALNPCSHVMLSQRSRLREIDPYGRAAEKFFSLSPNCCTVSTSTDSQMGSMPSSASPTYEHTSSDSLQSLPATLNYGARLSDSLYGNFHAYLLDARQKIKDCRIACSVWSNLYDGSLPQNSNTSSAITLIEENLTSAQSQKKAEESRMLESIKNATSSCNNDEDMSMDDILLNVQSLIEGKNLVSEKCSVDNRLDANISLSLDEQTQLDADIEELLNEDIRITEYTEETCLDKKESDSCIEDSATAMNSLMSLGESSGYESGFAFKGSPESTPDNETNEDRSEHEEEHNIIKKKFDDPVAHDTVESNSATIAGTSSSKSFKDNAYRQDVLSGEPNIGIFLDVLLRKLENMTSNNLYVNLRLTGLISRLAIYPQPLLQSFLLNHSLVFQPSIRSLFQILASLKHKIDQFLSKHDNVDLLVEQARSFLISREDKLVNARKNVLVADSQSSSVKRHSPTSESFARGEPKRKSLTSSFMQMIKRPSGSLGLSLPSSISQPSNVSEDHLQVAGTGYRYTKTSWESPIEISSVQNVVLCAVILDEWLKELAAITMEQAAISIPG